MKITASLSTFVAAVILGAAQCVNAGWIREPNEVFTLVGDQTLSKYYDNIGTQPFASCLYALQGLEPGNRLCIALELAKGEAGYYSATECHFNSSSKRDTFQLKRTSKGTTTVLVNGTFAPHDPRYNSLGVGIALKTAAPNTWVYAMGSSLQAPGLDEWSFVNYIDKSPQRIRDFYRGFGLTVTLDQGAKGSPTVNFTLISSSFDDPTE